MSHSVDLSDDSDHEDFQNLTISESTSPRFIADWKSLFPQLSIIFDNLDVIKSEIVNIPNWSPWPEDHFKMTGSNTRDWTVFPFLHTFPAFKPESACWVESTTKCCPKTTELLKKIPNIRTALFSKLGPGTELSFHTGWADLSNYVLRAHVPIQIPEGNKTGVTVEKETTYHNPDTILIFDDSKSHCAFNLSRYEDRIVLIIDIMRPEGYPLGTATGSHTNELDGFISRFK